MTSSSVKRTETGTPWKLAGEWLRPLVGLVAILTALSVSACSTAGLSDDPTYADSSYECVAGCRQRHGAPEDYVANVSCINMCTRYKTNFRSYGANPYDRKASLDL